MESKLIAIPHAGPIYPMGGVYGPIKSPFMAPVKLISLLVMRGYKVVEVLSDDYRLPLDLTNFDQVNSIPEEAQEGTEVVLPEAPPVVPVTPVEEAPAAPQEPVTPPAEEQPAEQPATEAPQEQPVTEPAPEEAATAQATVKGNNNKFNKNYNKHQKKFGADDLTAK